MSEVPEFNLYRVALEGFFNTKFEIFMNNDLYLLGSHSGSWSTNFLLNNLDGSQYLYLKGSVGFGKTNYTFYEEKGAKPLASLSVNPMKIRYEIKETDYSYSMKGNTWGTNFTIFNGKEEVGKVSRKNMSMKEHCGIALEKGHPEKILLGMVFGMLKYMLSNGM